MAYKTKMLTEEKNNDPKRGRIKNKTVYESDFIHLNMQWLTLMFAFSPT